MDSLIQTVVFLGYLDSLFSEGRAREVTPLRAVPETLNRLHADAMREHARRSALLVREDAGWNPVPDWRLDRQVIRVALYLRERLGVEPGQRVALLGELRPEWLIADLATLGLGAVSVAIDPRLQRADLTAALEDAAPRVTFVSSAALRMLESLDGRTPPHGQLIALGPAATGSSVTTLQVLLEMGGTLDTPERAQSYRADARSFAPDRPAVRHYREAPDGGWERVDLSQGEVIERLRGGWPREPSRSGDVAYVCDPTISPRSVPPRSSPPPRYWRKRSGRDSPARRSRPRATVGGCARPRDWSRSRERVGTGAPFVTLWAVERGGSAPPIGSMPPSPNGSVA